MPAPTQATYSIEAKIAANTALRDLIDAQAGNGKLHLMNEEDFIMATFELTKPCGTVNATTGKLVITTTTGLAVVEYGGYEATHAALVDSDEYAHLTLPAQEGSAPVAGKVILSSTYLEYDGTVEIGSIEIG